MLIKTVFKNDVSFYSFEHLFQHAKKKADELKRFFHN